MKNILQNLYELFYDINGGTPYLDLLNDIYGVNTNGEYDKIGWILLIAVPIVTLFLFYKVWEPMRKQRLMWFFTISLITLITYFTTHYLFLLQNQDILIKIGDYIEGQGLVNPNSFIVQISLITSLFAFLLSIGYSLIIKRFSTHNSINPF
jgi:energy-coupling factor transporter transmembrane protein EcfT